MTYEELNEVRTLKHKITQTKRKIQALEDCVKPAGVKFSRAYEYDDLGKLIESYTCLDVTPKGKSTASPTEILAVMLADEKKELAALQERLKVAIPELTAKIQEIFKDKMEQTLLIFRYVSCEHFRDIGFLMGYSENWVYWKHKEILKKFRVD